MSEIKIKRINNCRIYIDGTDFMGMAEEVNLPQIKYKTQDVKALGLYFDFETTSGGEKLEASIKLNSLYSEFITLAGNPQKIRTIIVRSSQETWDQTGVISQVSVKAELRGVFKEYGTGKYKAHEAVEVGEAKSSVNYFKYTVDDVDIIEIDVFANKFYIAGEDILAAYKENIGG